MKSYLFIICLLGSLFGVSLQTIAASRLKTIPLVCDFPLGEKVDLWCMAFRDSIAYVAAGYEGVLVLNIADPARPVQVHRLHTHDYTRKVAISGDCLCIADYDLGLAYIAMPSWPIMMSMFDTPSDVMYLDPCGPQLRLSCFYNDSIVYVNIADITNPRLWMAEDMQSLSPRSETNDTIFACSWEDFVVQVRTYPFGRREIGRLTLPRGEQNLDRFGSICLRVAGNSLQTIDVSNPAFPRLLDNYTELDSLEPYVVYSIGDYGIVMTAKGGIQIIDVRDPQSIRRVACSAEQTIPHATPMSVPGLLGVYQGMAYVSLDHRLLIFDVSEYAE